MSTWRIYSQRRLIQSDFRKAVASQCVQVQKCRLTSQAGAKPQAYFRMFKWTVKLIYLKKYIYIFSYYNHLYLSFFNYFYDKQSRLATNVYGTFYNSLKLWNKRFIGFVFNLFLYDIFFFLNPCKISLFILMYVYACQKRLLKLICVSVYAVLLDQKPMTIYYYYWW